MLLIIFIFGLVFAFLWEMKADIFLIVFGISVYIFLLLFVFLSDPIGTCKVIMIFLISNPILAFILFLTPVGLHFVVKFFKKRLNEKTQG